MFKILNKINIIDYIIDIGFKYLDDNLEDVINNELNIKKKFKYYIQKFVDIMEENEKLRKENKELRNKYMIMIKNIEHILLSLTLLYIFILHIFIL